MAFLLQKEDFGLFINLLMKSYDVIAPTQRNGLVVFSKIEAVKDIDLSKNSHYPPKKYFLPPKEDLLEYKTKKSLLGTEKEKVSRIFKSRKKVILGMRMCDVAAVHAMDNFYMSEIVDPYYKDIRENTYILALKCSKEENDNCFCSSFDLADEGYDLYLERSEDGLIVDVNSKKGKNLIDKKIFKASPREVEKGQPKCEKILSTKKVPAKSPAWQKYSDKCLSCCACNIVCPTCGCFDMKDYPNLDLKSGKRARVWDYCQSADYTKVAGNHIFRQSRLGRFKHRLLCKFEYFQENFKETTCTGCGRCITVCPTNVCDIPEIMSDING